MEILLASQLRDVGGKRRRARRKFATASAILIMGSASVSRHFKLKTFEHEGQQMLPIVKANVAGQGA